MKNDSNDHDIATPDASKRITCTVDEAAELLGISRPLAYEGIARNEIPHIKIGRRILVSRAALNTLLEKAGQAHG